MKKPVYIRDLLRRLVKLHQTAVGRELTGHGLTLPQILVLKQIFETPKTIGQISQAVDLSYSTISGIIDRLEREQLVERVRDQEDRRVIWIRKTDKLGELFGQIPLFTEEYYGELFQGLSESELDTIIHSLQLLIAKIEEKVGEKP